MGEFHFCHIPGDSTRDEDGFAIVKSQACTTQAELFYAEFLYLFQIMACKRAILSSIEGCVAKSDTLRWSLILARA